jgi:hypothetical protein
LPTTTFITSRLYTAPTLKECHNTFSGVYSIQINITSVSSSFLTTLVLYQSGFSFSPSIFEDFPLNPSSNSYGFWDCTNDGTLTVQSSLFYYTSPTQQTPTITKDTVQLKCLNGRCSGTLNNLHYALQLPVDGQFPGAALFSLQGIITTQKINL